MRRKVETSSSEAKIVRIGAGSFKIFPHRPEKGTDGLSFFALEEKIEQWIRILARKQPLSPGLLKQQCPALTLSIESYDKHLKTPKKRRTKLAKWITEIRQGELIYLISFKKRKFWEFGTPVNELRERMFIVRRFQSKTTCFLARKLPSLVF